MRHVQVSCSDDTLYLVASKHVSWLVKDMGRLAEVKKKKKTAKLVKCTVRTIIGAMYVFSYEVSRF